MAPAPTATQPPDTRLRSPRDAQRRRVYLAETPLPSSPLPGLDACARFADRVVGSFWWTARFPDRHLGAVPRLRPGQGARQAFYREDPDGPTITLPRRYRTKGVVLHELVHWALGLDSGLAPHGRTFGRVLLDATDEFCGSERAAELAASYRVQRVRVAKPARAGPDSRLHYGWDERLHLGRGRVVLVRCLHDDSTSGEVAFLGRFDGYERGASVVKLTAADGTPLRIPTGPVFAVAHASEDGCP